MGLAGSDFQLGDPGLIARLMAFSDSPLAGAFLRAGVYQGNHGSHVARKRATGGWVKSARSVPRIRLGTCATGRCRGGPAPAGT